MNEFSYTFTGTRLVASTLAIVLGVFIFMHALRYNNVFVSSMILLLYSIVWINIHEQLFLRRKDES